jgi:hypothetical protein
MVFKVGASWAGYSFSFSAILIWGQPAREIATHVSSLVGAVGAHLDGRSTAPGHMPELLLTKHDREWLKGMDGAFRRKVQHA